jgi:hypothetical protein
MHIYKTLNLQCMVSVFVQILQQSRMKFKLYVYCGGGGGM